MTYTGLIKALELLRTILEVGLDSGNVTSATSTTITDSSKDWGTNQWVNAYIEIVDGTGKGQIRKISANTSNTITIDSPWTVVPDSTSKYRIFGAPAEVSLLTSILSQLDIKVSELRDALKGANNKDLSTLEADVEAISSKVDGLAKETTLSSILSKLDITLTELRDALKGTGNRDFTTLETDVEGIKAQTDRLQFDNNSALMSNRLDSIASLRDSLTIPSGALYQVPENQEVIVKGKALADGKLYVEGKLLVV
jgi:hypothetical protein